MKPDRAVLRIADSPDLDPSGKSRWRAFVATFDPRLEAAILAILRAASRAPIGPKAQPAFAALETSGTSLWWLIEAVLLRELLKPIVARIEWLGSIAATPPAHIRVKSHQDWLSKAARIWAPSAKISVHRRGRVWALRRALRLAGASLAPWVRVRRSPPVATGRPRVLFSSMGRYQWFLDESGRRRQEDLLVGSILRRMNQTTSIQSVFIARGRQVQESELPPSVAVTGWHPGVDSKSWAALRGKISEVVRDPAFQAAFRYGSYDLWPALGSSVKRIMLMSGFQAMADIGAARRTVDQWKPRLVVVASETSRYNRALLAIARGEGIPTLALQHGSIIAADDYLVDLTASADELRGHPSKELLFPDEVLVFNDRERDVLTSMGFPFPERIRVTGQPRFDAYSVPATSVFGDLFRAQYGLHPTKHLVLVGGQTFKIVGGAEAFYAAAIDSFTGREDLQLVIKPHPAEKRADHVRRASAANVEVHVLPPDCASSDAIRAADVVTTFYSTIGLEAMLAEVPLIVLNVTGGPDPHQWVEAGAAIRARTSAELRNAVDLLFRDKPGRQVQVARAFAKSRLGVEPGGATARVLDRIHAWTSKREPQ